MSEERILVTGSRSIEDEEQVLREINSSPFDPDTIVNGGAGGVDYISAVWAIKNDANVEVHDVPEWVWDSIGKHAGPMRNSYMVNKCDIDGVIAIWDGESKGTKDTIDKSKSRGHPIRKVVVDVGVGGEITDVESREDIEVNQSTLHEYE